MRHLILIPLILSVSFLVAEKVSYQGYKLVRVVVDNHDDVQFLSSFENHESDFDLWGIEKVNDKWAVEVMLSQSSLQKYMSLFRGIRRARVEIVNHNVQETIDFQEKSMKLNRLGQAKNPIINKYARYSEINNFIFDVVEKNPSIASTYNAGLSIENRTLNVIVFKTQTSKRGIWIDCGIHAREWVTSASCVYIIDQIAQGYKNNDPDILDILNKYEVHVLALVNPDGYEYSHTTVGLATCYGIDRLWRKNRRRVGVCYGIDLNRNADFKWNTGGSSSSACLPTYAGDKPNSEPETMGLVNTISQRDGFWDAYYTLHSYGNWWLTAYAHSLSEIPSNNADLVANGNIAAAAIKAVNGQDFTVGSFAELLYIASGITADWAYAVRNIPFSFTIELRPKNGTGTDGFIVNESELPQITAETWAGIKASILDVSVRLP